VGPIAQSVEQRTFNPWVDGSSPSGPTIYDFQTSSRFRIQTMAKILIVGGAGYIGSHLAMGFAEHGHTVKILDDLSNAHSPERLASQFEFKVNDIRNLEDDSAFYSGTDLLVHCAAKKDVEESIQNPEMYFEINTLGTSRVIDKVRQYGIPNMIFSSTAAIYTGNESELVSETDPVNPQTPYGQSKLRSEEKLASALDINSVSLRYFNVAGTTYNWFADKSISNVFPKFFKALQNRQSPLIFGNDYQTPDGTCIRDYVHIEDVVRAHILMASHLTESKICGEILNIGSGKGTSVAELYSEIKRVSHSNIDPVTASRRSGDLPRIVADITKLQTWTGWKPTKGLSEIVSSSWDAFEAGLAR
jgi:UDP-glucose 4-epimerase